MTSEIKITGQPDLTSVSNTDLLGIVDVSDTSEAVSGKFKKITRANLLGSAVIPAAAGINPNSSGGHVLNNYELKDSFIPNLMIGGNDIGSLNYTLRTGSITRIGGIAFFTIRLIWSSLGGFTGAATISGLPVSNSGSAYRVGGIWTYWNSISLPAGTIPLWRLDSNIINLSCGNNISALNTNMTDVELTTTGECYISGWFQIV